MFEVLVFVYENYWCSDACPELLQLERKLSAAGFAKESIQQALDWLESLQLAARAGRRVSRATSRSGTSGQLRAASADSLRVYAVAEQEHLGAESLGFLCFLESAGGLPAALREIIVDRAMAVPGDSVGLDELKIIILMVYRSSGFEPEPLLLDELHVGRHGRRPH